MLPPVPSLSDYGISPENGFLPPETPVEVLSDSYYAKWEAVIANLQALLLSRRLRHTIDNLPVLSTRYLKTHAEWRRAYVVLVFMLHGYIWGGDQPAEVCLWRLIMKWCSELTRVSAGTTSHHNSTLTSV